jgi:hypothetical protein
MRRVHLADRIDLVEVPNRSNPDKRSNSAADFSEFCALEQLEAEFRANVWQSGAQKAHRNTYEFPVPFTAALIGRFPRVREKA